MGKKSKNKNRKFKPFDLGNNHPIGSGCSPSTVPATSPWTISTVKQENTTSSLADIQAEQLIISKQEAEQREIEKQKEDEAKRLKRQEDKRKIAEIMSELKPTMQEVSAQMRLQYLTARAHETSRQMCLKYPELASNNRIRNIIVFEKYDPMRIWLHPELSKYREEAIEIYNKVQIYK